MTKKCKLYAVKHSSTSDKNSTNLLNRSLSATYNQKSTFRGAFFVLQVGTKFVYLQYQNGGYNYGNKNKKRRIY